MTTAAIGAREDLSSTDIIRAGSKSFAAASMLFAPELRESVHQLYAWCRHCDDVVDGQEFGFAGTSVANRATAREFLILRQMTSDALAGKPTTDDVFKGLQFVMTKRAIPGAHALALLDGFAMDVEGQRYETIEDTLTYCYHVAGVVGVMMAMIMSAHDDETLDRASDLGIAFQLTNIARDLVDDARVGRCYVPRRWLADSGLSAEGLANLANRGALARLAKRLVDTADLYYASSKIGMASLPFRSCWAVGSARSVYRKIGIEVVKRDGDAWTTRVSTSRLQKLVSFLDGGLAAIDARTRGRLLAAPPRSGLWTRPRI